MCSLRAVSFKNSSVKKEISHLESEFDVCTNKTKLICSVDLLSSRKRPHFPVERISKALYRAPASPVEPPVHPDQIPQPQSSPSGVSSPSKPFHIRLAQRTLNKAAAMTDLLSTFQSSQS